MNYASLERSLQANRAYYARMFAPPAGEQIAVERKQMLNYFSREVAVMESRLKALEFELFGHTAYNYRPAWVKAAFDLVGAAARGRTLLIGEGNLSFSLSLARMSRITPSRLTATTFETERELTPEAQANARSLRALGATVLYGVDATDLGSAFGSMLFDAIVFQFPHVGSRDPVEGRNPNFILVRDFLRSTASQLGRGGSVLISAVDSPHYEGAFQFEDAAEDAGFMPPESHPFDPDTFPGYEHTMTHQDGSALENHNAFRTWVFRLV